MPETEQQDMTLSELVVKEAVGRGMDTPLRDTIVEAVEEAEGGRGGGARLPLAGALVGLGAAAGYLVGRETAEMEDSPLGKIRESDVVEEVSETDLEEVVEEAGEATDESSSVEPESSGSRLPRLLLVLGAIAGAAFLRRRMRSDTEEEWEPVEEFEPATTAEMGETDEDEEEAETEEEE
ncbi:hypothetical protein ACFQGT_08810 [Natrialbaceae archaeon GCM10025810]|uniref:hypothetical protein n=1 Tax=Halovalidus salilacus TaxID=3075124 RepID=UPI0036106954